MRRLTAVLVALCSAALLVPLLQPLVHGQVFVYNDLSWFHLPMRYLYQQAMRSGDTVLWTPSLYSGFYLHGEGQVGMFHPFHQLLYRLLPLKRAFNLEFIANYIAAFAGMTWLLRRLRFSTAASLFGAMLFAFSGFNLLHHHHVNVIAVVAHLPWLLAAADTVIVEDGRRGQLAGCAALSGLTASALLLGFPQAVFWDTAVLAAFCSLRAVETGRWTRLPWCAAALAVGVLLGGIQLLPTADAAVHSTRTALKGQFALTFSLHPYNLVQLWSPYFFAQGAYSGGADFLLFHEFGIYSGAILPLALIWVWVRRGSLADRRALIVAATTLAAVALAFALGRYGGAAELLTHVPVLRSLRAPVRFIMLAQFALVILATIAFEDLLAIAERRGHVAERTRYLLWIPFALAVATTALLNTGLVWPRGDIIASVETAAPGVAFVGMATLMIVLASRGQRWALAALVIVTAADLGWWGVRFVRSNGSSTIPELVYEIPEPPTSPSAAYIFVQRNGPISPNLFVMRGWRLTTGYVGLFPASVHPLDRNATLRLSGTRWVFTRDGLKQPFEGSADRVQLTDELGHARAGTVRLVVDRPGLIVADIDAPASGVVALTERFYDGWTATSPTMAPRVVRVESDFLGCVADAGRHQVTFRFVPRSFTYGWITSVVGALLLAGMLAARWLTALRA